MMEFKELLAAFAAKYRVEGLDGADGAAELDVDGVRVELLDDPQAQRLFVCAEIGHPPPDADGAFGAMMLQANKTNVLTRRNSCNLFSHGVYPR